MNLLNSFSFELPTKIEYGVGAVERLAEIIKALNAESLLVVTDNGSNIDNPRPMTEEDYLNLFRVLSGEKQVQS